MVQLSGWFGESPAISKGPITLPRHCRKQAYARLTTSYVRQCREGQTQGHAPQDRYQLSLNDDAIALFTDSLGLNYGDTVPALAVPLIVATRDAWFPH
jgi:hypothetical protein